MHTTIFSFTRKGADLCERIKEFFPQVSCYCKYPCYKNQLPITEELEFLVKNAFQNSAAIIFIGAAGIAVRLIAPFVSAKDTDPAVIVMDENARYVIPILSGHLGGANQIAGELAEKIGGLPVITTATDSNHVFAVDVWAKEQELFIHNIRNIKYISSALLKGEKIGFVCDYPVEGSVWDFISEQMTEAGILISENVSKLPFGNTLVITPRSYVIGIGCRKNISPELLEEIVLGNLHSLGISADLIRVVASINIKAEEPALHAFCNKYKVKLMTFTKEELNLVNGDFTPSDFVKSTVGVDNVCERAAYLASNQGRFILRKTSSNGVTVAIAKIDWRCRF